MSAVHPPEAIDMPSYFLTIDGVGRAVVAQSDKPLLCALTDGLKMRKA